MHDAIVADGVPRYMVTNIDVASMCIGGGMFSAARRAIFTAATVPLFVVHELMRVRLGEGECGTRVDVCPHQSES